MWEFRPSPLKGFSASVTALWTAPADFDIEDSCGTNVIVAEAALTKAGLVFPDWNEGIFREQRLVHFLPNESRDIEFVFGAFHWGR